MSPLEIRDEELYSRAQYPRSVAGTGYFRERITRSKFLFLTSVVSTWPGMRMLEVGCDHGVMLRKFETLGAECHGIDISADSVAGAAHQRIQQGYADAIPFSDAHFDLCLASHVIEHLEDPEDLVRETARVTRPGGTIALLYPWELFHGMTLIPDFVASGRIPRAASLRRIHRHLISPIIVRGLAAKHQLTEERSGMFWGFPYAVPQYFSVLRKGGLS